MACTRGEHTWAVTRWDHDIYVMNCYKHRNRLKCEHADVQEHQDLLEPVPALSWLV
jgi:hypothetical protein